MIKENTPLLSDDFLDEVAKEINQMFGGQNQSEEYSLNKKLLFKKAYQVWLAFFKCHY